MSTHDRHWRTVRFDRTITIDGTMNGYKNNKPTTMPDTHVMLLIFFFLFLFLYRSSQKMFTIWPVISIKV